jgi:hypothetical protein
MTHTYDVMYLVNTQAHGFFGNPQLRSSWQLRSSCMGFLISLGRTQGALSWYKIYWCLETKSGGNLKYKWATFVLEALPEDLSIALQPSVLIKQCTYAINVLIF